MKFADKLAKMRKTNNLSQEQLAEQLNVTRQSVSKWESGDTYPDMAKIIQICKILNCTLNDIMDDGVIKEDDKAFVKSKTTLGENIVKYFKDFLDFITKSVNMFFHMTIKCRIKMIIELIIVFCLIVGLASILNDTIMHLLWNVISLFPQSIEKYLSYIIQTIILMIIGIISIIVFIHYFKIRYLDYYVTLVDKNVSEQSVEEPIIENQNVLIKKEKEPVVIIRDAEHSSSKFMDGIVNVLIFCFKCFLVLIAIPTIISLVMATAVLVYCLLKNGQIFNSGAIIALGALMFSIAVASFIYRAIFNQKQSHTVLLTTIIVSLLVCGIGSGILVDGVNKLNTDESKIVTNYTSEVKNYDNLNEFDRFYVASKNIDFVIDENKDDILVELSYPEKMILDCSSYDYYDENHNHGIEYYINLYNELGAFRLMLDDITQMRLRHSYNGYDLLKVKITCNTKNKEIITSIQ